MTELTEITNITIDEITDDAKQAARLRIIAEFIKDAASNIDAGNIYAALTEIRCAQGFIEKLDNATTRNACVHARVRELTHAAMLEGSLADNYNNREGA